MHKSAIRNKLIGKWMLTQHIFSSQMQNGTVFPFENSKERHIFKKLRRDGNTRKTVSIQKRAYGMPHYIESNALHLPWKSKKTHCFICWGASEHICNSRRFVGLSSPSSSRSDSVVSSRCGWRNLLKWSETNDEAGMTVFLGQHRIPALCNSILFGPRHPVRIPCPWAYLEGMMGTKSLP